MLHFTTIRTYRFLSLVLCFSMLLLSSCVTTSVTKQEVDLALHPAPSTTQNDILHVYLQNGDHWLLRDYTFNDTLHLLTGLCNPHGDDVQFAMSWEKRVSVPYADVRQIQRQKTDYKVEPVGTTITVALVVGVIALAAFGPHFSGLNGFSGLSGGFRIR